MEMKQIRMGIVGAGTWGETHASIYAEHLFADPVAICDMNEARARAIADKYGIRKVYTDYHDLAADEEVDAVAIVTPDFAHADIAVAMADAKEYTDREAAGNYEGRYRKDLRGGQQKPGALHGGSAQPLESPV